MLDKFLIGHVSDEKKSTGVSVILAPEGAIAGVSVRGSAPGTRETDLLKSSAMVSSINAVVLSGGSAYGLEACCGVMDYLKDIGKGYSAGAHIVPIVCGAVLYDLDYKEFNYPDKALGYLAAKSATVDNNDCGSIGAGTGATVGKIMGLCNSSKSGLGVATSTINDVEVKAIVAVNAFGDVYDYETNKIIAGVNNEGDFADTTKLLTIGLNIDKTMKNTTLGCIITNAKLTKAQANKLADQVHNAYAMCIKPVHTMVDGDTIFSMSSDEKYIDFMQLAEVSIQTMSRAIKRAIIND